MDSTKTAIKSLVLDLRKTLEADIEVGLRRYGITSTALRPLETLGHLDDRGKTARIRMEEAIRHEMERAGDQKTALTQAVHWFVREVAFTHLNRLVGLKALEVRSLTPEIIQTRAEYGNRSRTQRDYRDTHPAAAGFADDGLEGAIQAACRQIYPEFHLLFDVGDPQEMREAPVNSLLWPGTPTLKACIAKINELDAKIRREGPPAYGKSTPEQSMWAEDEIIGWVYQFYNAEEKVTIREKGKPTHPSEVAVINQFFTPRWIVKFLVDNTLGRLWLEMHPDSPRVRAKCDYLVPEPDLSPGPSPTGERGESDSPINNPQAPARRAAKRPQDIRLIDPACGTMHFGHYAFEVFQTIYADAREQGWVKGADALDEAEVPAAILQNNLYGVDIDLRAIQLAALSLFMKAKSANPEARVGQVNLVVADAHLPHGKVREDFLAQYKGEPLIQQAFAEVFESLDNVAEVGSLLRVEERFRQSLEKAGHPSLGKPLPTRIDKYKGQTISVQQIGFGDLGTGWRPEYTVEQMLGHLREFARKALREHDLNAQLFANETEKSVALLDVFLHNYDVVVMNPPYGGTLQRAKSYLESAYPFTKNDLYAAFFERAADFVSLNKGYYGALTSRTFLQLPTFENLRKHILLGISKPKVMLDLGFNVLDDAMVETVASVFGISDDLFEKVVVFDLTQISEEQRIKEFETYKSLLTQNKPTNQVNCVDISIFLELPRNVMCYWIPPSIMDKFRRLPNMATTLAAAKTGLQTDGDDTYLRFHWEVLSNNIGRDARWVCFAKGGDYSKYYSDIILVVEWENNGQQIKQAVKRRWGTVSKNVRNESFYFREGLTYPPTTIKGFNARYLPQNCIFGLKGPGIFPHDIQDLWFTLGFLNSNLGLFFLMVFTPSRSFDVTAIGLLPVIMSEHPNITKIASASKKAYAIKSKWDIGNEISTRFTKPWLLQLIERELIFPGCEKISLQKENSIHDLLRNILVIENAANAQLQDKQREIDQAVYDLYEIMPEDQINIERQLGNRPLEMIWTYAEKYSESQKAIEHVARLVSYFLLQAIQNDKDGILPLSDTTSLHCVRIGLEKYFGENAAYQVELDSRTYLGYSLGEWLFRSFWKDFHVRWYKNRPILWQLQSQKGAFACLVHIHKMDRDTLPKLRTQYLWAARNVCQAALESARLREDQDRSAAKEVARLEAMLDDLNDFDKRLSDVIEARVKCNIPAWAQGPYRNGIYDPVLDDGVAVNILPLQEAGLLAKAKVV